MFGFRAFLLDLFLAVSSSDFFLDSAECKGVNDSRMVVLDIVFWVVTVIDHDLFGYAILDVGLVNNGIALILFIGEDGLYR